MVGNATFYGHIQVFINGSMRGIIAVIGLASVVGRERVLAVLMRCLNMLENKGFGLS
jgi:hypothetical protein